MQRYPIVIICYHNYGQVRELWFNDDYYYCYYERKCKQLLRTEYFFLSDFSSARAFEMLSA